LIGQIAAAMIEWSGPGSNDLALRAIGVPRILLRPFVGWLALTCLFGALVSASAQGACGDWLDGHAADRQTQRPQAKSPIPAPASHRPCNGPACRQLPNHPPAAPLAEVFHAEQWGLSTWPWLPANASRSGAFEHPHDEDRIADGYLFAVRRPPR
jgi:hypothetical protein